MRSRKTWATALAAAALGVPAARGQLFRPPEKELVRVRLMPDVQQVAPGQTFHLGVVFDVEPDWHIYWKNPGEGAPAPNVKLTLPAGFEVGEIRWPRPVPVESPIGIEYCYYDRAVLFVPVTAPPDLAEGTVTLAADLRWAVCRQICKMGGGTAVATVRAAREPGATVADPLLDAHRRRLPRPLRDVDGASIAWDGRELTLEGPAGAARRVRLFPDYCPGVTYGAASSEVRDGRFRVVVPVEVSPRNALGRPLKLGGLVALGGKQDDPCYDFELPLEATPPG